MATTDSDELNVLSWTDAFHEVYPELAKKEKTDLIAIQEIWGQPLEPSCRIAPSIITRSEAELFGISIPRFAIRVYLPNGGFINCRRLNSFISNVCAHDTIWGTRYDDTEITPEERNPEIRFKISSRPNLEQELQQESVIADCLLPEPQRLAVKNIDYINTSSRQLLKVYCEPHGKHPSEFYMPYVKAINLGGGLCAQAVAFMATICLSKYTPHFSSHGKVCGLAEITAHAHHDECKELSLSGLTPAGMERYFNKLDLHLSEQAPAYGPRGSLTDFDIKRLFQAMKAYLRSDMPIIFPVDIQKLAADPDSANSIYYKNRWRLPNPPSEAHAILIFGYSESSKCCVFNDPAALPFMDAKIDQLAQCGYKANEYVRDQGFFLPITPKQVKLPVLYERNRDNGDDDVIVKFGVLLMAMHAQNRISIRRSQSLGYGELVLSQEAPPGEIGVFTSKSFKEQILNKLAIISDALTKKFGKRWYWFHFFQDEVWVWDAEMTPPDSLEDFGNYLVAVVSANGTSSSDEVMSYVTRSV